MVSKRLFTLDALHYGTTSGMNTPSLFTVFDYTGNVHTMHPV